MGFRTAGFQGTSKNPRVKSITDLFFGPPASCRLATNYFGDCMYPNLLMEKAGKMPAVRFSPFVPHDRLLSPVDEFDVALKGRTSCIYFYPGQKGNLYRRVSKDALDACGPGACNKRFPCCQR